MEFAPGSQFGPYEIVRILERTPVEAIYHATHPSHRNVIIRAITASLTAERASGFSKRAAILVAVRHRNLATVIDGGIHDGIPFLAVELVDASSLADDWGSCQALPVERKLEIAIQACDGLQFAHEHGIAHLALTPADVHLLKNGGVKLSNVGLEQLLSAATGEATIRAGQVTQYQAPERRAGIESDGRSDIYAVGAILRDLVDKDNRESAASGDDTIVIGASNIRSSAPGLSDALYGAIESAMRADVQARYQHAGDFATDLRLARYAAKESGARGSDRLTTSEMTVVPATPATADPAKVSAPVVVSAEPSGPTDGADRSNALAVPHPRLPPATSSRDVPAKRASAPDRDSVPGTRAAISAATVARITRAGHDALSMAHRTVQSCGAAARRRPRAAAVVALALVAFAAIVVFVVHRNTGHQYRIEVRSTPSNARIQVDGNETGELTPATLTLANRPRSIRLTLPGRPSVDTIVPDQKSQEMIRVTVSLQRLLHVESEPAGAKIFLEDRDTGMKTPGDVPIPDPPPAWLELESSDLIRQRAPITEQMLGEGHVRIALARVPSSQRPPAAVKERPEAAPRRVPVTVRLTGSYPFDITGCGKTSPSAQDHELQVTAPCMLRLRAPKYYLDVSRQIAASSGNVEIAAPQLARVQLRSRYEWCTILLNGNAIGSPPVDVDLAAGHYDVVVQCPDRTYSAHAVAIDPGVSTRRLDDLLR